MADTAQIVERVNLVYQTAGDDGEQNVELPFRLLVLGDFSGNEDSNLFESQIPISVDPENIDQVLEGFNITLSLQLDNYLQLDNDLLSQSEERLRITLPLKKMADFSPDEIVTHVPQLKALCRVRALFSTLQEEGELSESLIQSRFTAMGMKETALSYLEQAGIPGNKANKIDSDLLGHLMADIDQKLGQQVDEILHHPDFVEVEASWRALYFLIERIDFRENCTVEILNVSKEALIEDFEDVPEIVQSRLYEIVYSSEFGQFGGKPYGVIIGNYAFGPDARHMKLLQQMAALASMAHAPFISAAGPAFFDVDHFSGLPKLRDLDAIYNQAHFSKWQAFRNSEDARYVGLTLPGFLLRQAYNGSSKAATSFEYRESFKKNEAPGLWGNSAFPFATRLASSFEKNRWCNNISGEKDGCISGLQLDPDSLFAANALKIPTQILISDRRRLELVAQGFTPLSVHKGSNSAAFYSGNSVIAASQFSDDAKGRAANLSHQMSAQFQYLFMTCRIAHYLKMMQREHIGAWRNKTDIEQELNRWLRQYVSDMDNPTPNVRVRRPFRRAKVNIEELESKGDWYLIKIIITPHIKFMGSAFALAETGKLDKA